MDQTKSDTVTVQLQQMLRSIDQEDLVVWENESLHWFLETKTVPMEITEFLEGIANSLHASGYDLMTQYTTQVKEALQQSRYHYWTRILFPKEETGAHSEWEIACLAMELRRYLSTAGIDKRRWSVTKSFPPSSNR